MAARIPVVLDTDIGTDFDDTWALHYLLARSDLFDVQLIQVSTDNTTQRAIIVANILATLGRFDVPIGVGRNTGTSGMPQWSIASSYSLEAFVAAGGTVHNGTTYFGSLLSASEASNPTLVVEIAPATSLGDVLRATPTAAANAIVTAMSGSIYHGYGNSSAAEAEYNVKQDIAASQLVYDSTWLSPMATAPLDTTVFDQFCDAEYLTLLAVNDTLHPYASSLLANYVAWYEGGGKNYGAILPFTPQTGTSTLYDLQAAYMAGFYGAWWQAKQGASPSFPHFLTQPLQVYVDAGGYTRIANATSGAQDVWPAVAFPAPSGMRGSVDGFAADVVAALIFPAPVPSTCLGFESANRC